GKGKDGRMNSRERRNRERDAKRVKANLCATPRTNPASHQADTSARPIPQWIMNGLRYPWRCVRWPCGIVLGLLILGRWIKGKDYWVNWAFRLMAVLSVSYLILDRIYETGATISVAASDPRDPFAYPFTLTNLSHLWKLHGLGWECTVLSLDV